MKHTLVAISLFFSNPVFAEELHVGSGQTYSTIASAISASTSGDTIVVHPGTYNESNLTPKSGLDNENHTIISGIPTEQYPVIDAQQGGDTTVSTFNISGISYVTLQYLDIRGGGGHERGSITIGESINTTHIVVDHCKVSETNVGGSLSSYNPAHIRIGYGGSGSNVTITNCELTGVYASGLKINTNQLSDIAITNNYIHDVHHGVAFKWGGTSDRNCVVKYNIIANTSKRGIYCDQSYVDIQHNVIDTPGTDGVVFHDNFGGTYCTFTHNTVYAAGIRGVYFKNGATNNSGAYNILYENNTDITDYGSDNNIVDSYSANPLFENAPDGNFKLAGASGAAGTADNSSDYGANWNLVGIDPPPSSEPTSDGALPDGGLHDDGEASPTDNGFTPGDGDANTNQGDFASNEEESNSSKDLRGGCHCRQNQSRLSLFLGLFVLCLLRRIKR